MVNLHAGGSMLRPVPFALLVFSLLLVAAPRAFGQTPPAPSANAAPRQEEAIDSDSPRTSLSDFLAACDRGDYQHAAELLELLPTESARGPALARKLKAVLDRHLSLDLDSVSAESLGSRADGLAATTDELGKIPDAKGKLQPVRLVRRQRNNADRWLFAHATVQYIDAWFNELPHRWMLDHLPEPLLRPGPRGVLRWQWMALPLLALLSLMAGAGISRLVVPLLRRIASKTPATWDDAIIARLGGPVALASAVGVSFLALPLLALYPSADRFVSGMLRTSFFVAFFWTLLRLVDVLTDIIKVSPWGISHVASRSLVSLAARISKVALAIMAVVAIISELGYPVASLIAGLGIGGLALALASQKTVENLFGAFSIGVDQPFREGDFVKIEDFMGTVEAIGLRSTRVRTLDRTLITVPNGKLAEMRIETFAVRDRIRLACTLGLVYGTTANQMRLVVAGLEQTLRQHPKIWTENITVRLKELTASSLDIEIMAWFMTADYAEFQLIRQEILLEFMEVVEKAGTSFAFPTRTVHLAGKLP
ncbi:MAG TPA: mechanosensitive ion channel family protein [Polyangiaceae bacterium]|nr:mechanosensitive ion channel family protein [Polyangiaceae bacterium]